MSMIIIICRLVEVKISSARLPAVKFSLGENGLFGLSAKAKNWVLSHKEHEHECLASQTLTFFSLNPDLVFLRIRYYYLQLSITISK